jgi:hypothetical protein
MPESQLDRAVENRQEVQEGAMRTYTDFPGGQPRL